MTNMRPPNQSTLLKVVILGNSGVGKSCLMNRFVSNRYDGNNFHTIGVEFMNRDIDVDGQKYALQIWDTAGQERFRALRTPFYRGTDICLLCYAINDRESFHSLKQWRDEFLNFADIKNAKFPFIVVGNKNDMPERERELVSEEIEMWCRENNIAATLETSAKTAVNVIAAFELAVRHWKQMERVAERELQQQNNGDIINLTRTIRLARNNLCCIGGENDIKRMTTESAFDSDEDDESMPRSPRSSRGTQLQQTSFQL